MTMWGDTSGAWEPLTDEQLAQAEATEAAAAAAWARLSPDEQIRLRLEYDAQHLADAQADAEQDEALERDHHFTAEAGQLAPHDYQCDDGCVYETDADRDARIDREEEYERLREAEDQADLDDGQPGRATSYPTFDDDPALWGLRTEQYASQAEADAAELLELWGPDGPPASYAAYVAEIEADREAGS